MSLFNGTMKQEDRVALVARMLGLSPNHPESWPKEMIENILGRCERRAELELQMTCRELMGRK